MPRLQIMILYILHVIMIQLLMIFFSQLIKMEDIICHYRLGRTSIQEAWILIVL